MKTVQGKPITASQTQMRPRQATAFNQSSDQAEQMIRRSPQPFQSRQSAVNIPAQANSRVAGPATRKGKLDIGLHRNMRGQMPESVNSHPSYRVSSPNDTDSPVGGGTPTTYSAQVGGRYGTSHPHRVGDPGEGQVVAKSTALQRRKANERFFGDVGEWKKLMPRML